MSARRKVRASLRKKKARSRKKARATKKSRAGKETPRRKPGRKKPARKKAAKRAAPSSEGIARKIVRATTAYPSNFSLTDLYADDAVSHEASGDPAVGIPALEAKTRTWESIQDSRAARWKARNVLAKGNTVCIEWEADLQMRDGRKVKFQEIAVHEIRGGKIVAERYYYNPAALAPPA